MISPSVHQMCTHSWELFVLTEGKPITKYAEECAEAWNKYIHSYKSGTAARAQQTSIKINTSQTMIKSHPEIASKKHHVMCGCCNKLDIQFDCVL